MQIYYIGISFLAQIGVQAPYISTIYTLWNNKVLSPFQITDQFRTTYNLEQEQ